MKFSIVLPLYNKESTIIKTINSVLSQSFDQFELLVINDGSTDSSVLHVKHISDSRIRLIQQNNKGVSEARNRGITLAEHEMIAFIDGDDTWEPFYLETIHKMIQMHPEYKWYGTNYFIKKRKKKIIANSKCPIKQLRIVDDFFSESIYELPIHISSVAINRQSLVELGMFPPGVRYGEDQDLFCRLGMHHKLVYSGTPCATYYKDIENSACKTITVPERWPFLEKYEFYLPDLEHEEQRNSVKKFVARRFITRAKTLKKAGNFIDAQVDLKFAKKTNCLKMERLRTYLYCILPNFILVVPQTITRLKKFPLLQFWSRGNDSQYTS